MNAELNAGWTRTNSTPPKAADLAADLGPVRSCKKPPVRAPAAMEFHGSSCNSVQRCVYAMCTRQTCEPAVVVVIPFF